MTGITDAPAQLPREIAGWECLWETSPNRLELAARRIDRRAATIGQALAGRIIVRRDGVGWAVEARLWILEDPAEHQRLRVRRGHVSTPGDLHDFLVDAGLPRELAISIGEAATALR